MKLVGMKLLLYGATPLRVIQIVLRFAETISDSFSELLRNVSFTVVQSNINKLEIAK